MLRILQKRVAGSLRAQWSRTISNTASDSPAFDEENETEVRRRPERCMNRVTLIGRVGRDPEQRGNAEHPCIVFPLATNQSFKKPTGERLVKTDWHRVVVFRPGLRDNVASRIKKGDRLFVEGSINYMKYNDDKPTTVVSINADEIMFLNVRQNQNEASEGEEEL